MLNSQIKGTRVFGRHSLYLGNKSSLLVWLLTQV